MTKINGQVESLKKLKNELRSYGINKFNSIKDINDFLYHFHFEKEATINSLRINLINEIKDLRLKIKENEEKCEIIKSKTITEIEVRIDTFNIEIEILLAKVNKSIVHRIFYGFKLKRQKKLLDYYRTNTAEILLKAIRNIQEIIEDDENKLKYSIDNTEQIINERSLPEIKKLNYIKEKIEDLQPLIAGAVGEIMVVKEIEKLPDSYILINDYNLRFNRPIYNRNTDDRIYSIQIDHLLISKSGVYILETKNWSKKSVESLDLRSPVEQITRTSYAMFIILNDAWDKLTEHHWGDKQIPVKNIIVMINEKPNADFKYVKVKSLRELNKYLTFFEPIFTENEVERIAKYLIKIQN